MKKEKLSNGLEVLKPKEGYLLYKKNEDPVTYHEVIYLAKMENETDYGEVTVDYVYGKDYDGQIEKLKNDIDEQQEQIKMQSIIIESQSEMIDYLLFFDTDVMMKMISNVYTNDDITVNSMAVYLARRIIQKKLSYSLVIGKFQELKADIDIILIDQGREDLIEEN